MEQAHEQPAYSYAQLPSNDFIRILELKPSLEKEAPLQSSLQIARLGDDDYPYDAVSYTWGEPVFSHTLYIEDILPSKEPSNGGFYSMGITANLSQMLRYMRNPHRLRRLWVDALCINQQDDVEKSNQIPLMFRIYQQAFRVAIWLGDKIEDQRRMKLLSIFSRQHMQQDKPVSTTSHKDPQTAQEAVHRLTELPWFSRLWIIQESVVNTDAVMYCGVEEISLIRLFDIVKILTSLSENQPARLRSFLRMSDLWDEYARGHASDISSGRCDGDRPCAIVDMMEKFQHFGCADARDRLYAISNLQTCIGIGPDYRLSPEQVFTKFAYSMRDHGQLQWIFREAAVRQCGKRTPGLPSWVPDLSIRPIRRQIFPKSLAIGGKYTKDAVDVSTLRPKDGSDALCLTNCSIYMGYGGSMYDFRPSKTRTWYNVWEPQSRRLRQQVRSTRLRFDDHPVVPTWRGDSFPDQPEPAEARAWIKSTFELVWQQFSKKAANVSSVASKWLARGYCIATVASTLVADGAHIGDLHLHPSTSKEVQELSDAISGKFKRGNRPWVSTTKGYSQIFAACLQELVEDTVDQTSMADAFIRLVIITMQGRCFFTCEDNPGMGQMGLISCGIGPSHMQIGDQALLHYMPFWEQSYLMRSCGSIQEQSLSCFELVGDCYLKTPVAWVDDVDLEFNGWSFAKVSTEEEQRTIILK